MIEPAFVHDVRRYLVMLHKRRAIVITCLSVSLLVAVLHNYTTRPVYQATAQILIDKATPKVLPTKDLVDPGIQDYQTEYELLRGRALTEKVVERLELQKSPELKTGPRMGPWERFQRTFLGKPPVVGSEGIAVSPAAAAIRSRLTIEPLPGGRLVNIHFRAYDPSLAAQVANTLAQLYIEQSLDFRFLTSSEATNWLSERLREQKRKVAEAERALLEYQALHGLVDLDEREGAASEKVTTLGAAVMSARMERIARETLLNQMRSLPPSQLPSASSVASSPAVQALRSRVAELQTEQARLSESLGEKHPEMIRLRTEIAAAQDKLQAEARSVVRALEGDLQAARAKEASLQANVEQAKQESLEIGRKAIEFGALKREVESNKQLFQSLMSRSKETGLETELKASNVRTVEKAEVPRAPILPRRARNYQIALLVGLALGIGLGLLFEHLDNTVKSPEDVKEHLGVPFLGMVPEVGGKASTTSVPIMPPKLTEGAVAEAYRVLRTNLIFSSAETSGRVLLVSSANPGEGKTTTVANLGIVLALNGAKVLLLDADLRRPTLHHHFALTKTPGLSDLIVGKCKASEAIRSTRFKGLGVLSCGYVAPNPAELLGSDSMKEILQALRSFYDWLLIDTPPVLAMADTPVLCPLADGVVLIVAAEESPRPAIQRAIDQILGVGGKITGVVLNRVDLKRNAYYYNQYYGEYYRSYYAEASGKTPSSGAAGPGSARRS